MRDRGNLVISNLQQQSSYLTDTGIADTYEVAFAPAIATYTNGLHVIFKATNANTGASTLEVNGLAPKDIRKDVSSPLSSGDIFAGQIVSVIYDGTNFQIVGGNTGTAVNVYNSDGSLTGDRVMTLGSYNFAIDGPNFNDYSYFDSGDIYLSMGDNTDHGFFEISQIVNGAAGQILIESGNDTVEMEMLVNGTAHTGTWHAHVDIPGTIHSHIEINETGVLLKAGVTAGTATGIDIDLTGKVGINKTVPTEKLDVVGNVRFSGALMPNNDAGVLGYKLLSGGAGVAPTWGADTVPISSLLPATATNTIDNANYAQAWSWNTLTGDALTLSTSTTASANNSKILEILRSGANGTPGISSYGIYIDNSHTGTLSVNYGGYFNASGARTTRAGQFLSSGTTLGYGIISEANGAGTNIAGIFNANTGTSNTGVQATASGATSAIGTVTSAQGTGTNIGLQASATTGTLNYAIIVPASEGSVGIGTSSPTSLLHVNGVTQMGTAGATLGQQLMSGNTSGTITIQPQPAAGTYNFNLPTGAGSSGEVLTSGGGGATAMTWTPVAASTWTPTLTNDTNVTSSTAIISHYSRIGNQVTFSGSVTVETTAGASTPTVLGMSLPISSNFGATTDASGVGTATAPNAFTTSAYIEGNVANDRLDLKFDATTAATGKIFFSGMYTII